MLSLALTPDGRLYVGVADPLGPGRVIVADLTRRSIQTLAGGAIGGAEAEGAQASAAPLISPAGLAVSTNGALYISDFGNHRVRRVDPDGRIYTVAGTGAPGVSGDGGPAQDARLRRPAGVALTGAGELIVADRGNDRVRRVRTDGRIETVAGSSVFGFGGDGGPAAAARLQTPTAVAVDSAGAIYVADRENHRVRRIDPSGVIGTFAGTGVLGYSGDGGLATAAQLASPSALALTADALFIAESRNRVIRKVALV